MKSENKSSKSGLPVWSIVALSTLLVASLVGSGTWGASASTLAQANGGRATVQDRSGQPDGGTQVFQDVLPGNPFFAFVDTIFKDGIVGGYPCGGPGEPCGPGSLPYYRPGATVTRGQMAKIIGGALDITTNTNVRPLRSISNAPSGLGVWGGNGGVGPARNVTSINAGVYGNAFGSSNSIGVLAVAQNDNAAWFSSNNAASYSIYVPNNGAYIDRGGSGPADALMVAGHVTITGGCTGCTVDQIMLNTGATDLRPGDVVSLGAMAPDGTTVHDNPVAGVTSASEAYSTSVVGVVGTHYVPGDPSAPAGTSKQSGGSDSATVIKPGEYMTVITSGTYKMVKVDAGKTGIHVGDLLTTSTTSGAAMKVTDKVASIGALLGKATGNLESGIGYIPVLITLK
ncbi:MAG: hypothetical protein ABI670_04055 [Chloroflexota bacterium]